MQPNDFNSRKELQRYCNENNLIVVEGKCPYFMDADDAYLGGGDD